MAYLTGIFILFGSLGQPIGIQQIKRESLQKLIDKFMSIVFSGHFFLHTARLAVPWFV
jgi:hypothetical protein